MALDQDERLARFFSSAPQDDHIVPVLEVSHSAFPKTYRLWREPVAGSVTLESGEVVDVLCINFDISLAGSEGKLDQAFTVALDTVDHEDEFRAAVDAVPVDSAERVRMVYREFLFSDLDGGPGAEVPLQVEGVQFERGTATLSAVSPRLNATRTGEPYAPREVPMLRAFQ